jgi:hypothetical protein
MTPKLAAFTLLSATALLARADNPDPNTIDLPKNMEFAAQVTLLKTDGGKPRGAPLKPDQAVQLRFDKPARDTPKTVPCTLNIPKKMGQVASGEAAVVGIKCSEVVYLPRDQLGFKLIVEGREVGSGAFRP